MILVLFNMNPVQVSPIFVLLSSNFVRHMEEQI